jgi:hypothetical protein
MMGILNKLMFWKKGDEDLGDLGLGADMGDFGKDITGLEGAGASKPLPGFGEKEHIEGMESPLGTAPGAPRTEETEYAMHERPGYGYAQPHPAQMQAKEQIMIGKELELISTKLDSLKITLDSLNMRIASLERIARGEYEKSW